MLLALDEMTLTYDKATNSDAACEYLLELIQDNPTATRTELLFQAKLESDFSYQELQQAYTEINKERVLA
jgi:hypothetical protein